MFSIKKISETKSLIQEFILSDFLPIPKNTTCIISSRGGLGKTNLCLKIASNFINSHTGNVGLWLTEDEGGNIKYRVDTLINDSIIEPFNENRALLFENEPIHLSKIINKEFVVDLESFNNLKLFCIENDIRLLVLDPLLAFYGGNENDNSQARTFMQPFIQWCKETDITIILVHHASKGDGSSTRGASAFIDAVRCVYHLSVPLLETKKNHYEVDELKFSQGIRMIECVKDNRGAISKIYKAHGSNPFEIKIIPKITLSIQDAKESMKNILANKNQPEIIEMPDLFMGDD